MSRKTNPAPRPASLNPTLSKKALGKLEEDATVSMAFNDLSIAEQDMLRPQITVGWNSNQLVTYLALTENELLETRPKQRKNVLVQSFEDFSEEDQAKIAPSILVVKENDQVVDIRKKFALGHLPEELMIEIFKYCPDERHSLTATSKNFQRLSSDRAYLRKVVEKKSGVPVPKHITTEKLKNFLKKSKEKQTLLNEQQTIKEKQRKSGSADPLLTSAICCGFLPPLLSIVLLCIAATIASKGDSKGYQTTGIAFAVLAGGICLLGCVSSLILCYKYKNRTRLDKRGNRVTTKLNTTMLEEQSLLGHKKELKEGDKIELITKGYGAVN